MLRLKRLNPNERLLVVSPVNKYKIVGPGRVFLTPRQQILANVYVGPNSKTFKYDDVRTAENVTVDIKLQIVYRADPDRFSNDLLSRIPPLANGAWQGALNWHAEYVLRTLIADYTWRDLSRDTIKERLERQLVKTLDDRLKIIGLNVFAVYPVNIELPVNLQKTLIQAERDNIEAQGRTEVLKKYLEIFGDNLAQAMPYIIQWELMNSVHKNGDPKILLTTENMQPRPTFPISGGPPMYQLQVPVQ